MNGRAAVALVAGAAALVMIGGAMKKRREQPIVSSLDELLPPFRAKLEQLLILMRGDGHDPMVHETYRAPARALELAERGTGKERSQHTLRAAADILDRARYWKAAPQFWDDLHRHALQLGLGRVKKRDVNGNLVWDLPHVQALPGAYDAQMHALAPADREQFLLQRYAAA